MTAQLLQLQPTREAKSLESEIFDFWKEIMGHKRARMDVKRQKIIKDRLRDGYTYEDITDAISGCFLSPFHQGDNDRNSRYDDISLICRDAEHIDKFIQIYEEAQQRAEIRSRGVDKPQTEKPAAESCKARLEAMKRTIGMR